MKYIISLLIVFCSNYSYCQIEKTVCEKVCLEFRKEVEPYLQKFSKSRITSSNVDDLDKALISANYNLLLAKLLVIEKDVNEVLSQNSRYSKDKLYISKLVGTKYRQNFVGLPTEFWKSIDQRINEL